MIAFVVWYDCKHFQILPLIEYGEGLFEISWLVFSIMIGKGEL
jgi:hypothetical protein